MKTIINSINAQLTAEQVTPFITVQYGNRGERGFQIAESEVLADDGSGTLLVTHENWIGVATVLSEEQRNSYPAGVMAKCVLGSQEANIIEDYKTVDNMLATFGFPHLHVTCFAELAERGTAVTVQFGNPTDRDFNITECELLQTNEQGKMLIRTDDSIGIADPVTAGYGGGADVTARCYVVAKEWNFKRIYGTLDNFLKTHGFTPG